MATKIKHVCPFFSENPKHAPITARNCGVCINHISNAEVWCTEHERLLQWIDENLPKSSK